MTPRPLGLVLTGGGARGAYQVGAWKAWRELGLEFDVVAGASVGALNAAIYACDDFERAERVWATMQPGTVFEVDLKQAARLVLHLVRELVAMRVLNGARENVGIARLVKALAKTVANGRKLVALSALVVGKGGVLSTAPLQRFLDDNLDYEAVTRSKRETYISVCGGDPFLSFLAPRIEFHKLQALHPRVIRQLLLASAAIPLIFPAVESSGRVLSDGGILSAGNLPLMPVTRHAPERALVVHLRHGGRTDPGSVRNCSLLDIAPSQPLLGPGGVLKFASAASLIEVGYQDARKALSGWHSFSS